MGTIDIEKTVFEFTQNDNIYWDEEKFSFEEYENLIKQAILEVTDRLKDEDGEIEDWDIWEQDIIIKANKLLGNED